MIDPNTLPTPDELLEEDARRTADVPPQVIPDAEGLPDDVADEPIEEEGTDASAEPVQDETTDAPAEPTTEDPA